MELSLRVRLALKILGGIVVVAVVIVIYYAAAQNVAVIGGTMRDAQHAARRAAMKSALTGLREPEERFFAQHARYASTIDSLGFYPPAGLTLRIVAATDSGWSATATHGSEPGWVCAIFVGTAPPPAASMVAGESKCFAH